MKRVPFARCTASALFLFPQFASFGGDPSLPQAVFSSTAFGESKPSPLSFPYDMPPKTPSALVAVNWKNKRVSPRVSFRSPDGKTHIANPASKIVQVVPDLSDSTSRWVFGLKEPMAGKWTIEVTGATRSDGVDVRVMAKVPDPVVSILSVRKAAATRDVKIEVNVTNLTESGEVSFSASEKPGTCDGALPAGSLNIPGSGKHTYSWDGENVAPGTYFIGASVFGRSTMPSKCVVFPTPVEITKAP